MAHVLRAKSERGLNQFIMLLTLDDSTRAKAKQCSINCYNIFCSYYTRHKVEVSVSLAVVDLDSDCRPYVMTDE